MIDYLRNTLLKPEEKDAVQHYRDVGSIPTPWTIKFTKAELGNLEPDCLVINGYLRGTLRPLCKRDIGLVEDLIERLDSGIGKCVIGKNVTLYKGLSDINWIKNARENEMYRDLAFGSFSEDYDSATVYALPNLIGEKIYMAYLILPVSSTDIGLYIDKKENEFLLPRGISFKITSIDEIVLNSYTTIMYYNIKLV